MGVIDIRRASVGGNNIGSVRVPDQLGGLRELQRVNEGAFANLTRGLEQGLRAGSRIVHENFDRDLMRKRREDKRQLDAAMADSIEAMNQSMIGVDANGNAVGFLQDAMDIDKAKGVLGAYEKNYEKILQRVKKDRNLTDEQYAMLKEGLLSHRLSAVNQLSGRIATTYDTSEQVSADKLVRSTEDSLVTRDVISDEEARAFLSGAENPAYRRAHRLVNEDAVMTKKQDLSRGLLLKRQQIALANKLDELKSYDNEADVDKAIKAIETGADPLGFIPNAMQEILTDAQKQEIASDFKVRLASIGDQAKKQIEARRNKIESDVEKNDREEFAKVALRQLEPDFVLPNREAKIAEIKSLQGISEDTRLKMISKWKGYFDKLDAFDRDQKEKNGEAVTVVENGERKTIYLSSRAWGKTDPSVEARLKDKLFVANNSLDVLAEIEALRATGQISGSDYFSIRDSAYAAQDQKTAKACSEIFGGKFADMILAKWGGEKMDDKTFSKRLGTDLYYKRGDSSSAGGYNGVHAGGFEYDALKHKKTETDESVFTLEEKSMLLNSVREMARHGFTVDEINTALERIIAPKQEEIYRKSMTDRLQDKGFMDDILRSSKTFQTKVTNRIGAIRGQTGFSEYRDAVDPSTIAR